MSMSLREIALQVEKMNVQDLKTLEEFTQNMRWRKEQENLRSLKESLVTIEYKPESETTF